jgi:zinc D-Ala-D-Ala carboxypeptidase
VQITQHFSLWELTTTDHREFDNTPSGAALENLYRLAEFLELVKIAVDMRPIIINSAFRSLQVNRAVGSKDTSHHVDGRAADIRVPGMSPDEVVRALIKAKLKYHQLIREFDRWTHVSIPIVGQEAKGQVLIIDKKGTRGYI